MLVMRRLGIERTLSDIALHPDAFVSRQWDTGEILFELPFDPVERGALWRRLHQCPSRRPAFGARNRRSCPAPSRSGGSSRAIDNSARGRSPVLRGRQSGGSRSGHRRRRLDSKVRDHLLGPDKPRYTGHIAHRADLPASRLNGLPIRACTKWWGPGNHILVYYMTQAREEVYVVTSAPQPEWTSAASFVPCDRDEFVATFDGYHARAAAGHESCARSHQVAGIRSRAGQQPGGTDRPAGRCLSSDAATTWRRAPPWRSRTPASWHAASPRSGRRCGRKLRVV